MLFKRKKKKEKTFKACDEWKLEFATVIHENVIVNSLLFSATRIKNTK